MAVRLLVEDENGDEIDIHLVSIYRHSDWEWDGFEEVLDECISCKKQGDVVVIGADCNASIGVRETQGRGEPCGRFGNCRRNDAGSKLRLVLAARSLVAPSAFFKRRRDGYGTWRSMAPPFRLHQLDHFSVTLGTLRESQIVGAGV